MATYKVIQDIEAEDKLIGPLTLRQFIYAGICAVSLYLSYFAIAKGAPFMVVLFLPVIALTGFFAFPFTKDQPTEVWALAKIRFMFKPRKRIWDQSGTKELVTVTAPHHVQRVFTNGLNEDEVQSRLNALANTIDSRGWAVKNANVNLATAASIPAVATSDRLVEASSMPQEVTSIDVRASDDMMDPSANAVARQFDTMIQQSAVTHHQQLVSQMAQPAGPPASTPASGQPADYWFMHQAPAATAPGQATFVDAPVVMPGSHQLPAQAPQAAIPTPEEEALAAKFKRENSSQTVAYGHLKTLKTPAQLAAEAREQAKHQAQHVTPRERAAIMNLASNDDLDVATLARQAKKQAEHGDDGEVVISLR